MTVRLIAISKPLHVEEVQTPEQLLGYFARVSSQANQLNHDTAPKLINSLITRKEWSPLEMISATIEITTTRDIARQILRHRSFSFQEFSQRYAAVTEPPIYREARLQDTKDRQNSIQVSDIALQRAWEEEQIAIYEAASASYDRALKIGIAKEVARVVLPEGMTPSRLYMAGTARSWFHYCQLRMDRKTQKEHRIIAEQCWAALSEHLPTIFYSEHPNV